MKATGIVRRIDDLGRVVIPKEIRKTLRIREGEPLEIYTEKGGEVVFKKYSPIGELGSFAAEYADAIYKINAIPTIICDKDNIVAAVGVSRREFLEKPISNEVVDIIETRANYVSGNDDMLIEVVENSGKSVSCVAPILSEGSPIGAVITLKREETALADETEIKVVNTAAEFLSKQIDY